MSLRLSEQQYEDELKRRAARAEAREKIAGMTGGSEEMWALAKAKSLQAINDYLMSALPALASSSKPKRRGPNKLEAAYGQRLEGMRSQGEVLAYLFERMTLKIADDCRYTPDYFVVTPNGMELHEVKGPHAWEDSIIKLKVAADLFPWFRFSLHKRVKGEWISKEIRPA